MSNYDMTGHANTLHDTSLSATPLHRHPNPQLPYPTATPFTRSERLFDSPGPQALLIHKVRWPYQSTWPAGLINSPGQFFGLVGPFPVKPLISYFPATPLHRHPNPQLPYPTATPFTRSACLFDSPSPQALLIHTVRRAHQST